MHTANDSQNPAVKMIQAVDRQDWPAALELAAPTARAYVGAMEADRDGWRAMGQMFYAAFPDARHEIHSVHVSGEYTTVIATFTGTHRGEFMGVAPTGKRVSFGVIHVDRVVNGRIVEHRGQFDSAGLMQQLTGPAPDLRAFVEKVFARIDGQDFDAARELVAPEGRFCMGGQTMNRDQWRDFSKMFYAAFPDGRHVNEQVFTMGDRAVHVGYFAGTHRGAFQGVPPTGRAVKFSYIGIMQVQDGKVLEERVEADFAGLMQLLTAPSK